MEASFEPQGCVGIAITDQLYIDFSAPNNFDQALQELIDEIRAIHVEKQTDSSK